MCTAWLLDQGHEITLIEKKDYLGGNTHTVDVEVNGIMHHVDDGHNHDHGDADDESFDLFAR